MNTASRTALVGCVLALCTVVAGCADSNSSAATTSDSVSTTTTLSPTTSTSTVPLATTSTAAATTTTEAEPTTTTTTSPAIVFPTWRLPNHGEDSAVAYVAYAMFGASDALDRMNEGHARLDEIDQDLWEGYGSLGCDQGAEAALGLDDGLSLGVYFDTPTEAHAFADAWDAYFGEPLVGVVDSVTTFCLD